MIRRLLRFCGGVILMSMALAVGLVLAVLLAVSIAAGVLVDLIVGRRTASSEESVEDAFRKIIEEMLVDLEKTLRGESAKNPPPPVSPLKEAQLSMPLDRPEPGSRRQWPPFTGVRVELGEGST